MCAFCCVRLVLPYQAERSAWGTSPKRPILCRVGRKTLTQLISYFLLDPPTSRQTSQLVGCRMYKVLALSQPSQWLPSSCFNWLLCCAFSFRCVLKWKRQLNEMAEYSACDSDKQQFGLSAVFDSVWLTFRPTICSRPRLTVVFLSK